MQALYYEERAGNGIGAAVAEKILEVTERVMQESSSAQPVLLRSTSVEVSHAVLPQMCTMQSCHAVSRLCELCP